MVRSSCQSWSRENESDLRMNHKYNILCKGEIIYSKLTEEEYFDTMEDLASEFYETGIPHPSDINTEIIEEHE